MSDMTRADAIRKIGELICQVPDAMLTTSDGRAA